MLYEIFEFLLKLSFGGLAEFLCLNLCHENGHGFAEDKIHFLLARPQVLQRHIAALFSLVRKKYQKSTRRVCAPSRLPGTP